MHNEFLNISWPSLHGCVRKLPYCTCLPYSVGEQIFFFFLRFSPSGLNCRQFCQHLTNLMKVDIINEVCNSMNSLLSDLFGLLSSRNFATMARNNSSFLFSFKINSTTQKYLFLRAMRREH